MQDPTHHRLAEVSTVGAPTRTVTLSTFTLTPRFCYPHGIVWTTFLLSARHCLSVLGLQLSSILYRCLGCAVEVGREISQQYPIKVRRRMRHGIAPGVGTRWLITISTQPGSPRRYDGHRTQQS